MSRERGKVSREQVKMSRERGKVSRWSERCLGRGTTRRDRCTRHGAQPEPARVGRRATCTAGVHGPGTTVHQGRARLVIGGALVHDHA